MFLSSALLAPPYSFTIEINVASLHSIALMTKFQYEFQRKVLHQSDLEGRGVNSLLFMKTPTKVKENPPRNLGIIIQQEPESVSNCVAK